MRYNRHVLMSLATVACVACGPAANPELSRSDDASQAELSSVENPLVDLASRTLLDKEFKVYTNGSVVINHPAPGFTEKVLPTNNNYAAAPGCYMACYSHEQDKSAYGLRDNIYVMGQVRVPGKYQGHICMASRYASEVSNAQAFKDLCNRTFADVCNGNCWAGGDTGGWFGIPRASAMLAATPSEDLLAVANRTLLNKEFKVYTNGQAIINHPAPGFTEKVLPTNNEFSAAPGCYLACYSNNQDGAVYGVGENIFVMGQVRVAGSYQGRLCKPQALEAATPVSASEQLKAKCNQTFPVCKNGCWAGGDTGGWFGIPG